MPELETIKNLKTPRPSPYPLFSVLFGLLLVTYLYLLLRPEIFQFYQLPAILQLKPVPEITIALFFLVAVVEVRWVMVRRKRQKTALKKIKEQMAELLVNRKQLHAKAHVYASHADKLKLFISDKLLEYIEYDEKFLHFKNIASEVRHNGIISYDKVKTVLEQQSSLFDDPDSETSLQLKDAQASLRYLWDLLDLATTDNIALHIANQVCELEELIFQAELDSDNTPEVGQSTFLPIVALEKSLARCFGSKTERVAHVGTDSMSTLVKIPEQELLWVFCESAGEILGNENHAILALENLISNAQYFAGRKKGRKSTKDARIAIALQQRQQRVYYCIYNRGQHIDDAVGEQLFGLGFSTRRVKEHHGKGLGLYFVQQIVKGYDGAITYRNVFNQPEVLSLRLELANGQVITDVIEIVIEEQLPKCRKTGNEQAVEKMTWDLNQAVTSIEVTHQSDQITHRFNDVLASSVGYTDPSQPIHPRWRLRYDGSARRLELEPMDISGVLFELTLPSLQARIEGDLLATDQQAMADQVDSITRQFKSMEE